MAAVVLKPLGYDITILEQKSETDMQSYNGISLGPYALKLLNKHKPYAAIEDTSIKNTKCVDFDVDGQCKLSPLPLDSEQTIITTTWSTVFEALRADITAGTAGYGGNVLLNYDCQVTNIQEEGSKMRLFYLDKKQESQGLFDLVIGADGAHSLVRSVVQPDLKAAFTGYVAWRGEISETHCSSGFESVKAGDLGFVKMPNSRSYILLYAKPSWDKTKTMGIPKIEWCWYSPCEDLAVYFQGTESIHTKFDTTYADEWKEHLARFAHNLPSWIDPLIRESTSLSISKIVSFDGAQNVFYDGKVLLVGQAYWGNEPYLGKGCDMAAYEVLQLASNMPGFNESKVEGTWTACLQSLSKTWSPQVSSSMQDVANQSKRAGAYFRGEIPRLSNFSASSHTLG